MAEYDDLFSASSHDEKAEKNTNSSFDKTEWAQQKQLEREQAFTRIDTMAEEISVDGDMFKTYLDVQSRFDRYSVGNALLITSQMPEATRLADAKSWNENGAYINKGETAVVILEPGEEFTKDDGTTGVSYNVKKVFDISQTNAEAPVETAPKDDRLLIKALIHNAPVAVTISNELPEGINAQYSAEKKTVFVRQGLDGSNIFRALSQELAHAKMDKGSYNRSKCAFPAYCVSYILCKRNGFDVSDFSFNSLPREFKDMDAKGIRTELGKISDAAKEISANMSRAIEPPKNRDVKSGQER